MISVRRVGLMAEMQGRDLIRRRGALVLLVALPLAFYLVSSGDRHAPVTGGVGMAFAVSGAALFSILSSRDVDQRLVLTGYRPIELLLGRLGFLAPLGLAIAGGFGVVISLVSHPARWWIVAFGLATVALQAVSVGLAVGAALPRELEGTLVLIGVIGVELATKPDAAFAKLLPFDGARRIIEAGMAHSGPIAAPFGASLVYSAALLAAARVLVAHRVFVRRPTALAPIDLRG